MDEQLRSRLDAGIRDAVLKAAVEAGLLLADGERRGRVYRGLALGCCRDGKGQKRGNN
jgi:hypothetical protein